MKICEYGCEKEGKYQFKNGKWCCSKTYYECISYREKISLANRNPSKETKEKMSKVQRGKILSEEHKKKISKANKNPSKEARKKMSEANKGKIHSEEHKKKLSEAHKGQIVSEETRKKISETLKNPSKEMRKKMSKAQKGRKHSKESRKKMRLAAINRIKKNSGQISPNYNPEACKLIEKYGIRNGCDFQHAENGGEFYIKELGYWVDGYDREKNIVIEIDESHHFDFDGNLNIKDLERQQEIIDFLGCEFIRLQIN